jgi:hypothetical protein
MAQNLKNKKDHLQDFGIDLENNIKMDREGTGCIDLDQNKNCWQAVERAVMSPHPPAVHKTQRISCVTYQPLACPDTVLYDLFCWTFEVAGWCAHGRTV